MTQGREHDVVVIGGGTAGLAAAVRAAEGGAEVALFEPAALMGGLVANVGRLDDYPAGGALAGTTLADQLATRARELGVAFVEADVTGLESTATGVALTAAGVRHTARSAVVASGAKLRTLGVPGETELAGRGVSQCDWCDGGLYRGRRVAVVGGGDAAVQAALHLAETCESVTLIVRGPMLSARRAYVLRVADHPRIEFRWETVVEAIEGTDGVDALALFNSGEGTRTREPFAAVFVFVGLVPNLDFAPALKRDEAGRAITDAQLRSSMPNVFVAGAARSGHGGSLLAALGEGTTAGALAVAALE